MTAQVLIAVTHLLGSGHLVRAGHLARALAEAGHEVVLASGGMPLRDMSGEPFAFAQLPPVRVQGTDFRNLLDARGLAIDDALRAERRAMLVDLASRLRPGVVVTEHFPFGRRQLAGEFLALIAAAKAADPSTLILSSIRDVLVTPRADRVVEAHARIAAHFDGVLVHGDEAFLPLEASWPVTPELAGRLHYTGYMAAPGLSRSTSRPAKGAGNPLPEGEGRVRGRPFATAALISPQPPASARSTGPASIASPLPLSLQERGSSRPLPSAQRKETGDILVSGGGSGAALPLFEAAIAAARLMGEDRRWRILVGRAADPAAFALLAASAPSHVAVEWARPDFASLLAACALSISQAGYNTVLDLVAAGPPAIVVPFDEGAETEQAIRAGAMARAGLARMLRLAGDRTGDALALAAAVADMLRAPAPPAPRLDRDGAAGSVAAIARLLAARA